MSRGGINSKVVENSVVALGDNDFETGYITVAGKATIKKGFVLKRAGGKKFAPVTDDAMEKSIAVNPFDITNPADTSADLSVRAIISGRVRADLLTINGVTTTPEQNDMLRDYAAIIPLDQNDISRTN